MPLNRAQLALASIAMLAAGYLAHLLEPRELMARSFAGRDLSAAIPRQFGNWTFVPSIGLVTPAVADEPADTDPASVPPAIYDQVVARGYQDGSGHIVMLLVAYGTIQDARLKAHRPELCYVAAGFRITDKTEAAVPYRDGYPPIMLTRLIAQRESRLEPVSYWMRVGDEISHGVVDRQLIRLRYGLRGIIPDGALIRVSTIGMAPAASFELQNQFIRDLLAALNPKDVPFFTGKT
jgi:EpsI family protein